MNKEDFLNKLRKNTHVQFDMPAVDAVSYTHLTLPTILRV